jgi:hypothetical protein
MYRVLLVLAVLAAKAQAGTIVIDDFVDPASLILPSDVVEVATANVGDLDADRRLLAFESAFEVFSTATIEIADGEYSASVQEAGEILIVYAFYNFPATDFTPYEAIDVEIDQWSDALTIPHLRISAIVDDGQPGIRLLTHSVRDTIRPGVISIPLASFTDRGGNPVNFNEWSRINELQVSFGGGRPWDVSMSRITVGNAIPESSSFVCFVIGLIGCSIFNLCRSGRAELACR